MLFQQGVLFGGGGGGGGEKGSDDFSSFHISRSFQRKVTMREKFLAADWAFVHNLFFWTLAFHRSDYHGGMGCMIFLAGG